jgi:hypothetical protein
MCRLTAIFFEGELKFGVLGQGPDAMACTLFFLRDLGRHGLVRDYTPLLAEVNLQKMMTGIKRLLEFTGMFSPLFCARKNLRQEQAML